MTISNELARQTYTGTGSNTTFAIPFQYTAESEVKVYLRDESVTPATETLQTVVTEYTLTGGTATTLPTNVEMITAPTSDEKLIVIRELPYTQTLDLQDDGKLADDAVETAFDRGVLLSQQIKELLDRSLVLPVSSPVTGLELPELDASGYLKVTGDGLGLEWAVATNGTTITDALDARITVNEGELDILESSMSTKTGDYTTTNTDNVILVDASGGDVTITLPTIASATQKKSFLIKLIDDNSYANVCTIDGNGSETIEGATTHTLTAEGSYVRIQSNGTEWKIIDVRYTDCVKSIYNSSATTTSTTLVDTGFSQSLKAGIWETEMHFNGSVRNDSASAGAMHIALTDDSDTALNGLAASYQLAPFQIAATSAHITPISSHLISEHTLSAAGSVKIRYRIDVSATTNCSIQPTTTLVSRRVG